MWCHWSCSKAPVQGSLNWHSEVKYRHSPAPLPFHSRTLKYSLHRTFVPPSLGSRCSTVCYYAHVAVVETEAWGHVTWLNSHCWVSSVRVHHLWASSSHTACCSPLELLFVLLMTQDFLRLKYFLECSPPPLPLLPNCYLLFRSRLKHHTLVELRIFSLALMTFSTMAFVNWH